MPRILGVDVPGRKRLPFAFRYIYGVGPKVAMDIIATCKLDETKIADDLTAEEIALVVKELQENHLIEGDLRRETQGNIRRLISTGSYRGFRHRMGLPVRGQRTKTNARTRKGGKRTVGAVRGKDARSAAKVALK